MCNHGLIKNVFLLTLMMTSPHVSKLSLTFSHWPGSFPKFLNSWKSMWKAKNQNHIIATMKINATMTDCELLVYNTLKKKCCKLGLWVKLPKLFKKNPLPISTLAIALNKIAVTDIKQLNKVKITVPWLQQKNSEQQSVRQYITTCTCNQSIRQ